MPRKTTRSQKKNQEGSVLIGVMVIGVLLMLLASSMINYFSVTEDSAVEESLVNLKVYWAMMGHANYMFSRARGQGVCDGTSDLNTNAGAGCASNDGINQSTSLVGSLKEYLVEIQGGTVAATGSRQWDYPTQPNATVISGNQNSFNIEGTVRDRDTSSDDGRLRLDLVVPSSGTVPALLNLNLRIPRLSIGFCMTNQIGWDDTNGNSLLDAGDAAKISPNTLQCGTSLYPDYSEGMSKIQFIRWLHPLS